MCSCIGTNEEEDFIHHDGEGLTPRSVGNVVVVYSDNYVYRGKHVALGERANLDFRTRDNTVQLT